MGGYARKSSPNGKMQMAIHTTKDLGSNPKIELKRTTIVLAQNWTIISKGAARGVRDHVPGLPFETWLWYYNIFGWKLAWVSLELGWDLFFMTTWRWDVLLPKSVEKWRQYVTSRWFIEIRDKGCIISNSKNSHHDDEAGQITYGLKSF